MTVDLRNIDLNLLVIFEAVYATGNISQAARQMGVSQPTISNSLNRLRDTLNDPLFVRHKNGVTPTLRASKLIAPVRDALQILHVGITNQDNFDPAVSEHNFKLIIAEPMEPIILPTLINKLPQGSKITFDYYLPVALMVEESLISGKCDLAVFLLPTSLPELHTEILCPLDLVGIARKGHPRIRSAKSMAPEFLANEGHVTMNLQPGNIKNVGKFSLLQTLKRRVVCKVSNIGAVARIVSNTDLVGILPRLFANKVKEIYKLNIFEIPIEINKQQIFMIWHKRHDSDGGHIWLRRQIREAVDGAMDEAAK